MKVEIAELVNDEKKVLKGFKILGLFPYYLSHIQTGVHIKLCKIKELINKEAPNEASFSDFYDSQLQEKVMPLINEYVVTALLNNRPFSWVLKPFIKRKIEKCGHGHIWNLFHTILDFDQPAFFLAYWKLIKMTETTLLKSKEDEHS